MPQEDRPWNSDECFAANIQTFIWGLVLCIVAICMAVGHSDFLKHQQGLKAIEAGYQQKVDVATKKVVWFKPCDECECACSKKK